MPNLQRRRLPLLFDDIANIIKRYRTEISVYGIGVCILSVGLLRAYFTMNFNSDDVAQKVMLHQTILTKSLSILSPPDNFIFKLPINIILDWFVHSPNKNLFISAWIMNALGLLGFFVVGVYFFRKYGNESKRTTWLLYIPFLWLCSNSSNVFLYDIRSPQIRTIEIGAAFVILWIVDKLIFTYEANKLLPSKKLVLWLCSAAIFTGIFVYSDPAFVVFLFAPLLIAGIIALYKDHIVKVSRLVIFITASYMAYVFFKTIFSVLGVYVYRVPANFVQWGALGTSLTTALDGLLQLQNAYIFGLPLYAVTTTFVVINLCTLIMAFIYIPRQLIRRGSYWFVFFAIQPIFLFCIYALSNNVINVGTSRYLILLPYYEVLLVAFALLHFTDTREKRRIVNTVLILLMVVTFGQLLINSKIVIKSRHATPNAYAEAVADKLLTETNEAKGYAPYWNAGVTSFYTGMHVDNLPIICDGTTIRPYYWAINEAALNLQSQKGSFIIVTKSNTHPTSDVEETSQPTACSTELAVRQFGAPRKIVNVTNYTQIYIYNYDILQRMPRRTDVSIP